MEKLLAIAERHRIMVQYYDFIGPIKGFYLAEPNMPAVIGLSNSLKKDTPLLRCILAEELGHHFTTTGQWIPRQFYQSSAKTMIFRVEHKALRWAAKSLIPRSRLMAAVEMGIVTTWELADYFRVTEDMVRLRCGLPDLQRVGM